MALKVCVPLALASPHLPPCFRHSWQQDATKLEESVNTKAASAEAQRVQTLAAYRREEGIVSQEAQEVAAQVRTLEAQLRALKSRQVRRQRDKGRRCLRIARQVYRLQGRDARCS